MKDVADRTVKLTKRPMDYGYSLVSCRRHCVASETAAMMSHPRTRRLTDDLSAEIVAAGESLAVSLPTTVA